MNIFVSDRADADILQIYKFLAERNPAAAESLVREIDNKFQNLSRFPFIGRERCSWCPKHRGGHSCDFLHDRAQSHHHRSRA